MRRAFSILLVALALTISVPVAAAQAMVFFESPSGNIGCLIDATGARCDIGKHDFSPPPKPSNCPLDWGYGLMLGRSGPGHFFCGGDTVRNAGGRKLAYGHSIGRGIIRCTSAESGIKCVDRLDGHGFKLSREAAIRF